MSSIRRIRDVAAGLLMLLCSAILLIFPEDGYMVVVLILDLTFLLYGIRMLIYYFTMTRYMVGGIMTLYKSIVAIDFGLFIFNLDDLPKQFTMFYLMGIMLFNGVVVILSALDAKRLESPAWKSKFVYGMIRVVLALSCVFFRNSAQMVTFIYCIGLIHAAFYRIAKAFQKTAIIHIG